MPQFIIGNKEAEKWTYDEVEKIIFQMLDNCKTDNNILCLQDAIHSVDLYSSSLNYLIEKYPVFESIKSDMNAIIIGRINNGALKGTFISTPAIFRMKQCGEKDLVETKNETTQTIVWNETKTYDTKPEAK